MKDLTSGNIYKTFFLFSIPMILSSVLSQAFGIIDTSIAGLFLGSKGLAALGASSSALAVIEAFFWGMNAGISIYMANAFGAKDYPKLKSLVLSNQIFIIGTTLICAALAIIFHKPILAFLNIEDIIYTDSRNYFFLMFINMPFALSNHLFVYVFSSIGMTTFPLCMSIISSIINITGNILSVTVFDLGVIGLGFSTILSSCVVLILYFIKIRKCFKEMDVDKIPYRFSWKYVKMTLPSALPNGAQQLSMYLAGFIISPIKNGLGYIAIASLSIVGRVQGFMTMFYGNCARTVATYIPQCVGAKKYHNIKKAIGVAFIQSLAFVVPLMIVIWLFPHAVCSLFVSSDTEAEVINNVVTYIKLFLPFMLINAVSSIFHSTFRGIKSNRHLFISTTICSVVSVAASFILCPIMGITGYYLQAIISWAAECVYISVIYFSGLWVPKDLRPMILKRKQRSCQ